MCLCLEEHQGRREDLSQQPGPASQHSFLKIIEFSNGCPGEIATIPINLPDVRGKEKGGGRREEGGGRREEGGGRREEGGGRREEGGGKEGGGRREGGEGERRGEVDLSIFLSTFP
jgi:ATP-dependent RNA helicase DHX57